MVDLEDQSWQADHYACNARFVSDLGAPVFDLLAPIAGERILDLGCGDGALTARLVAAGARVVAVDAAPDMVAAAKARGLDARLVDACALDFAEEFDAVFSNAVLHWVADIDRTVAGVARALKPGGRFVGEFGGHGNVAAITVALLAVLERHGISDALVHQKYYPSPAAFTGVLDRHGFLADTVMLVPRPTPLPTGMDGWLDTFAGPFLNRIPEAQRRAAKAEVVRLLAPVLCDESGNWTADYMRLRFAARRRG